MEQTRRICLALGIAMLMVGCSEDIRFINVAPTVTSIGPIQPMDEQRLRVYVTIQDFESDPVDLLLSASDTGGNDLNAAVVPGEGHGVIGLSSSPDSPGTLHEVIIEVEPTTGSLFIEVTPDDFEGGPGHTVTTPEFVLTEGLSDSFIP